ncbi:hypothetical protein LEP1GSC080_2500 [Leptospira interrogans str. FPW2026]|nr:hypothetical protein LEP1GSC080_2500 [Leptospira interrogans str. FPW2026]
MFVTHKHFRFGFRFASDCVASMGFQSLFPKVNEIQCLVLG